MKEAAPPSAPKSWASHLFTGSKPAETPVPGSPKSSSAGHKKSTHKESPASGAMSSWGEVAEAAQASSNGGPASSAQKPDHHHQHPHRSAVLYIRDLPPNAKESDVRELFSPFGTITGSTVSANRGFAFVDYESSSSVEAALKCCPFTLLGMPIHVEERPPTDRRDGNRYNRDGGRSGRGRGRHSAGRGHSGPNGRMGMGPSNHSVVKPSTASSRNRSGGNQNHNQKSTRAE